MVKDVSGWMKYCMSFRKTTDVIGIAYSQISCDGASNCPGSRKEQVVVLARCGHVCSCWRFGDVYDLIIIL